RLHVDNGAEASSDQALDFLRAATLLASGGFAAHAVAGRARQHAVFRRDPALARIAHPARHLFLKACGAQDMRIAKLDEAGALGMFGDAAFERDGAHFVSRTLGWTHEEFLDSVSCAAF